jgi:hypothetical protein
MHTHKPTRAALPRRRLSLRFEEIHSSEKSQVRSPLPRNELRRIVAEMVG